MRSMVEGAQDVAVHGPEELRRVGRLVRQRTRASLMSDTKWRKLFAALDGAELELQQCVFKFIGNAEEKTSRLPSRASLYAPHAYLDSPRWGPFPLREIEWLRIPRVAKFEMPDRTIPARTKPQNVDAAMRVIEALGRYPVELTDEGLCIRGYITD